MASRAPKPTKRHKQQSAAPEVVDPAWLIKAIAITLVVALLCAYATFCLLFYQGQWQIVLHPSRTSSSPQSIVGAPYELIHFGPDESATPQLVGWWIPAAPGSRYSQTTLLFLPGASGSLADSISTLATLHNLGLNVFAFDYRGYGRSSPTHPSQQNMLHDTEAAWQYLTTSRHISSAQIIPYGIGIGASLATHLASTHSSIPAIILDAPSGDLLNVALHDPRSNLVPVHLLFHELFPLADPLANLRTPKLLISYTTLTNQPPAAFHTAANPKLTVELTPHAESLYTQAITRFLDQYVSASSTP